VDVTFQPGLQIIEGEELLKVKKLGLQRAEEALYRCVVEAIPFSRLALPYVVLS
jgi:hypothetical protein